MSLWQFVPLFHCSTSLDTITVTMHHCSTVPPYFTTTVTLCHCSTVRPYVTTTVSTITPHYYYSVSTTLASIHFVCFLLFNNCIAKMEVGCLEYPGASTISSQPLDWNNAPMTGTTAQPSHEPPHERKGTGTLYTENISGEKNQQSLRGGGGRKWLTEPSTKKLNMPMNHMINVASYWACTCQRPLTSGTKGTLSCQLL